MYASTLAKWQVFYSHSAAAIVVDQPHLLLLLFSFLLLEKCWREKGGSKNEKGEFSSLIAAATPFTNTQQELLMSKLRYGKFKNGEERCKRHKNVSFYFIFSVSMVVKKTRRRRLCFTFVGQVARERRMRWWWRRICMGKRRWRKPRTCHMSLG